jgi:hypothetical protein
MLRPPERRVSCRMRALKLSSALLGHCTFDFAPALGHPQRVAQELAPQGAAHRALGFVDLKLQAAYSFLSNAITRSPGRMLPT